MHPSRTSSLTSNKTIGETDRTIDESSSHAAAVTRKTCNGMLYTFTPSEPAIPFAPFSSEKKIAIPMQSL
jgi:hypothetical protein